MISSVSDAGSSPDAVSTLATSSASRPSRSWRGERFTAIARLAGPGTRACQPLARVHGLAQHPAADLDDQPGLLGQRDELDRRQQPAVGVLPADQRLEPADLPGLQPDRRLVVEDELGAVQRAPELGFQVEPGDRRVVHRGLVHADPGLALGLGPVHRHVGVAHQLLGTVARVGSSATPTLAVTRSCLAAIANGSPNTSRNRSAIAVASSSSCHVLEQDRELVAAEARRGVAGPELVAQPVGRGHEQLVAGGVAEAVVDRLEPVEVEDHHRERPLAPGEAGDRVVDAVGEQGAVGQLRQRVVERPVAELALEAVPLGDVLDRDQHRVLAVEVELGGS